MQFPCHYCGKANKHKTSLSKYLKYEYGVQAQFYCTHCPYRAYRLQGSLEVSYIHEAPQDSWLMNIPIFLLTSSWWPCRYLLAQLPGYAVPVSPVRQGLQAQDFPYQAPQVWMRHGGTVPMPTLPLQSQAEGLLEITYIYETPTDSWLIINLFVLFLWYSLKLFDCIVIYYKEFCSIK